MPTKLLEEAASSLGAIAAAAVAAIYGGAKVFKSLKTDRADAAVSDLRSEKAEAETDVITLLRSEIARLHDANRELLQTIGELRNRVQELEANNIRLSHQFECMQNVNCPAKSPD